MNIFKSLMREEDAWNKVIHSEEYNKGFEEGYRKGKKDAAPKWIPVTERLPKKRQIVVVTYCKNTWEYGMFRGLWREDITQWIWKKKSWRTVLFWMPKEALPLPEPYKEEKDGE